VRHVHGPTVTSLLTGLLTGLLTSLLAGLLGVVLVAAVLPASADPIPARCAEGPMQFEPATFAEYAVRADRGARLTPYDPADAIFTAARMLCADGAARGPRGLPPGDLRLQPRLLVRQGRARHRRQAHPPSIRQAPVPPGRRAVHESSSCARVRSKTWRTHQEEPSSSPPATSGTSNR